ncbi:Uncharacterised protein [Delftia tsuruhatensis]|nr:Uncharacterised protein [Delftia tsuruhatensis]CAC9688072.1 Uncharacterised protein [Delftia tsuruhatensis]
MSTTPIVALQRTRNRIIEYLELASSFDAQTKYQASVPGVRVPNELLNQWEDWANGDWLQYEPAFTPDEIGAMGCFQRYGRTSAIPFQQTCRISMNCFPPVAPTGGWSGASIGRVHAVRPSPRI